ncbi:hypothetical protein QTG54_011691 [Skeletonema marinoi]|uniref:Uncharacterized protein n=1 Tax=Skeletonema marinoi TaxID=267567 RepID=A0AAD8Y228_9STRA|nr:hypothetical protein QTG54_011691 [Skeletonema marinoi]
MNASTDGGGGGGGSGHDEKDDDTNTTVNSSIIHNPLIQHLTTNNHPPPSSAINDSIQPSSSFHVNQAVHDLQTKGYHHIPSILTNDECSDAMSQLWEFVSDVSGGCVLRDDPKSWYSGEEVSLLDCHGDDAIIVDEQSTACREETVANDDDDDDDMDPWPFSYTGSNDSAHDDDMMQSLGAGYLLGNVRELLASRVFEPLFGTDELLSSKEGFAFCRPMIVDLDKYKENDDDGDEVGSGGARYLVWNGRQNRTNDQQSSLDVDQDDDRGVASQEQDNDASNGDNNNNNDDDSKSMSATTSKKQYNKLQKKLNKQQRYKDLTGLCHIRAAVPFTDQTIDQDCNGGHFLCYPHSYSTTSTAQSGLTRGTDKVGERIYAKRGDVILWRSDLVHATVAPSLTLNVDDINRADNGDDELFGYRGSREFGAVSYCSMLPVEAVKEYNLYSVPKRKMHKKMQQQHCATEVENETMQTKYKELTDQKLEAYRTGRTGDHHPEVENWLPHQRVTMWNAHLHGDSNDANIYDDVRLIPPRLLQRPKFRLGAPKLTLRQAELYGLLSYRNRQTSDDDTCSGCDQNEARRKEIERAVSRGVRFVEGVYKDKDMNAVGPWTVKDGRFSDEWGLDTSYNLSNKRVPICQANMELLTPCSENGQAIALSGQDKYLGGMASPCGRYIYGVPGHAKQLIQVDVNTRKVETIGPEYHGEFKWLRGVEIPATDMGKNEDGSFAYPSGCCLALPCNSPDGCVLKVDPATGSVSTFITDPIPNGAETGWLYHGDPRLETTTYIGPEFTGKAKWYGGLLMADGCIYGVPHNSSGVLKIDPTTDEVNVLAEGTLPEGQWKWHGGLASLDGKKFIGFPNNEDSILVFDVEKQKVYTAGDGSVIRSGNHRVPQDGGYKYLGGSLTLDGKFAYLFPCDAEYVLKFNMETDQCQLVGPHLTEGENKFQNGFVGRDGCIYGCPQRASGVLRIIPPGVKRCDKNGSPLPDDEEYVDVMYCGDDMVGCKDKMEGGVLGMDG